MPLDGFRIMDWVSLHFGGLPASLIGGLGVATLLAGVFIGVMGLRMTPVSLGLVSAGASLVVLTYFIIGAAVTGSSVQLAGGAQVQSAAHRVVPAVVTTFFFGMGFFGLRSALRAWSSEEASGKAVGVLLALASLGAGFVGVQVYRGASSAPPPPTPEENVQWDYPDDTPARPRGVTAPPRR